MVFVIIMGLGGLKLYKNGWESGYSSAESVALKVDKAELVALNQENEILRNKLDRERRTMVAVVEDINDKAKVKIKDVERKKAIAVRDLSNALQLQLARAEDRREDEDSRKREIVVAHINGLEGTEGAKLAPETRYDLESLSLDADQTAILLGLCQDTLEADRR